jgi:hypothetical protein
MRFMGLLNRLSPLRLGPDLTLRLHRFLVASRLLINWGVNKPEILALLETHPITERRGYHYVYADKDY